MAEYSVADAKNRLPKLIDKAIEGEEVIITRRGKPVVELRPAATSAPADVHAADRRLAYAYVRRFDLALRAPDALHLAIAHRLNATLVTLDGRLERAAGQLGIAVEVPETT